jgi:hypothetical protein
MMQIGVDSFGAVIFDPATGLTVSALQRMDNLLDEIVLADQVGLDIFGIGSAGWRSDCAKDLSRHVRSLESEHRLAEVIGQMIRAAQ